MGLIKEPKNVDFYVIDKPWTENERKELSAYIKLRKQLINENEPKAKRSRKKVKA